MAIGSRPVIPRRARPTASAAIASRPRTPTTPLMANAAAGSACARPNRPVSADAGEKATLMWRDRVRYRDHQYVPDTFWLVVAALLFTACGLVWLIGQVAAILFGAHEHLPVRLVDMLGVLLRLPGTWDDPAQAWPPSSQRCCRVRWACTPQLSSR